MVSELDAICIIKKELRVESGFEDAECIPYKGKNIVATTDMLTEGEDFPPGLSYEGIGWNTVAANLSDLAAAGAKPIGVLVAWGLPREIPPDGIRQIAAGMSSCARAHKTRVIGGDMNETDKIVMCGTAIGVARYPLRRSGAKPGDILALTGKLGASAAGYHLFWSKKQKLTLTEEAIKKRFERPIAPTQLMSELNLRGLVHAATDISDGFAAAVHNLCSASGTGALIEYIGLPFFEGVEEFCKKSGKSPLELINLSADYEVLAAIPPECFLAAKRTAERHKTHLYEVGTVLKKEVLLEKDGKISPLSCNGFFHFR
ncbi:MAG: thiamine-phosphate kinase [Candidatus Micrarchaeota archaeon]|nr:thiamine-phosphate kinase [Candidatus Micrarchaeota archaeon]